MFYDFECPKCHAKVELQCSIKDYDKEKENQVCPTCSSKMERVIKGFGGLVFNSNGFYCTDKGR